jgi:hypothetical protein
MLIKAGVGKNDAQTKTSALGAAALTGDLEMVRELIAYGEIRKVWRVERAGPVRF